MHVESQSDLFIRMLADALKTDRIARAGVWSPHDWSKVTARTTSGMREADHSKQETGPLDCAQMMAPTASDRWTGWRMACFHPLYSKVIKK